jgi:hypothetical protein
MAILNATTMERDCVNFALSVPVQKCQQAFDMIGESAPDGFSGMTGLSVGSIRSSYRLIALYCPRFELETGVLSITSFRNLSWRSAGIACSGL